MFEKIKSHKFCVNHLADSTFSSDGLRSFFEYRDLGVADATSNSVNAHIIRSVPGAHASGQKHIHNLEFQMVYVLKGWVRFWYKGVGEVELIAGSCVHQPSGIIHQELAHSDDIEMLEITLPAQFETHLVK